MFCGLTPITFRRKLSKFQGARGSVLKKLVKGKHESNKKRKKIKKTTSNTSSLTSSDYSTELATPLSLKNEKKKSNTPRNSNLEGSLTDNPKCSVDFILMVELRKNIFAFRDMIDLPSLDSSLSVTEIITHTMKDLQKLSPEIVNINKSFQMEGVDMDKMLIYFYDDLRAIGDSWIMDSDWIYQSKYKNSGFGKNKSDRLVEHVLAALDGLIKMTRERFGMMDLETESRKSLTPTNNSSETRTSFARSLSCSDSNSSLYQSPFTPTSVLPGRIMLSNSNSSSPSLWNSKSHGFDTPSPVSLKHFNTQFLPDRDLDNVHHRLGFENCIEEEIEEDDKDSSVFETEDHHIKDLETEHHVEFYETEEEMEIEHHQEGFERVDEIETEHNHVKCYETEHHIKDSETRHKIETKPMIKGSETEQVVEAEYHIEDFKREHEIEAEHLCETINSDTNITKTSPPEVSIIELPPSPPPPPSPPQLVSLFNKKAIPLSQPPPPSLPPQLENKSPTPPPPPALSPPQSVSLFNKKATTPSQPPPPKLSPQPEDKSTVPPQPLQSPPQVASLFNKKAAPPSQPPSLKNKSPPPPPPSKTNDCRDASQFTKPESINGDKKSSMPAPPEPPGSGVPAPPAPPSSGIPAPHVPPSSGMSASLVPPSNGMPSPPAPTSSGKPTPPAPTSSGMPTPPAPPGSGMPTPPAPPGSGMSAPPAPPGSGMPTPPAPPGSGMPAPPAPPGKSSRAKKATSKLKRSAQIANLYWVLKKKVEGRGAEGKTEKSGKGKKIVAEKTPGTGMADALAEMTKRSSYFQQIEEDVQKHSKSINELKSSIQNFQTKDMKELLEFHSKIESVLEKLSDETQVLAKFEGFPEKKLEAIRSAGALYTKLDGILEELKNWKIEPPLNELLDKIERYFNKFKGEIEAVERTKDEEAKMFQRHNINIDFQVLVQLKETMVDVSSNCMELALKERREANEEAKKVEESKREHMKSERAKMLWRAFQFAFKVYTFAGGHDDRADHLTRELAHEIETDPVQTDSSSIMS